jgi:TrmH family RNA methyltransferase
VLFGNEAHGLDLVVREHSDMVVRIPMREGAESLNLAAAAAVFLFEAARRRR